MSSQTELTLVLRTRNEAAEILRKHGEETSRIGSAYRLAARQVEVFRDPLQQTATGMASLTGMVRGVRADVADNPALSAWVAGDPDRTPQAEGDVVRERTVRGIERDEPIIVLRSRILDQVGAADRDEARRIAASGGRSPAADDRQAIEWRGQRNHRPFREDDLHSGLREGRAGAAAFDLPDLAAIRELKAAVDATLRHQVLLMRSHVGTSFWRKGIDMPGTALEHSSDKPIEQGMGATRPFVPVPASGSRRADPSAALIPESPIRDARARSVLDVSSNDAAIAEERRALIAAISACFTSLSREVARATTQIGERKQLEDGGDSEERILERLTLALERLAPAGRQIEEAVADRRAWLPERGAVAVASAAGRRASAVMGPEWIGSTYPEHGAIGSPLRDVTADWQAYGSGIAKALGATDQVLAGILTQTRDWRSAMHSLINSVVSDFARIAIRQNLTGPLADAVFGGDRSTGDAGLLGRAFGWITSLFAGGGVMTGRGPLPLRTYASGGIATSPQLALFGEGSTPEAYVPVPNGRIPVTLRGGNSGIGSIATSIVINVTGGGGEGAAAGAATGPDPAEQARNIGAMVSAAFNRNLAEQMRPGGLLNPAGYLGSGLVH